MERKRSWWLIAMLSVLALVAAACGDDDDDTTTAAEGEAEETAEEATDGEEGEEGATEFQAGGKLAEIVEDGQITVGTKFDQPLFGQVDPTAGGEPVGFDVEIAELIVDEIEEASGEEIEVEFVETPSAIRETALVDGTVDMVVATYTINDTRKQQVDFAGPYYIAGQDIMVRADDTSVSGVEDLAGKIVCSVQGSTSIENARRLAPDAAEFVEYDVYSKCADDLGNGRVDAVTTDNVILVGLVDQSDGAFELVDNPFTEEPYGIGLPKGDQEMRDFVNDALEEIFADGRWAEAYDSTVGTVAESTPEPPTVDRY